MLGSLQQVRQGVGWPKRERGGVWISHAEGSIRPLGIFFFFSFSSIFIKESVSLILFSNLRIN